MKKTITPKPLKRVPLQRGSDAPVAAPKPTGQCIAAEVGCAGCNCGREGCGANVTSRN